MQTLRYIITSLPQGIFSFRFLGFFLILVILIPTPNPHPIPPDCTLICLRSGGYPLYINAEPYQVLLCIAPFFAFGFGFLTRPLLIKIWKTIKKTETALAEEQLDKKQIITLLVYIAVLTLSILWFLKTFDYEPLIGILVGAAGLFGIK